jgi:hypothetical protein
LLRRCQRVRLGSHGNGAVDGHRIAKEVEHGTMRVDRLREFLIARVVFWASKRDAYADGVETRAHLVVETEKAAKIDVSVDVDFDLVEPN